MTPTEWKTWYMAQNSELRLEIVATLVKLTANGMTIYDAAHLIHAVCEDPRSFLMREVDPLEDFDDTGYKH